MSICIILENPPEFYTNLDVIRGHVVLSLDRHEHVGAIIVKLEGESQTALGIPSDSSGMSIATRDRGPRGDALLENHKILYKAYQAFPDENAPAAASPYVLNPGQHRFPFQFKFPFNNVCGNSEAMARLGGVVSPGGVFGVGFRVMDGTKQLMYRHVTKTLPPSFTGFPREAEIRYYLKVTIQRPGLFKENWRHHVGLKFMPIEPPRPPKTNQEAYARRPFTFHPRSPNRASYQRKPSSFFGWQPSAPSIPPATGSPNLMPPPDGTPSPDATAAAPSIEMSARLPHPAILTCHKPVPLRLIAKKLAPALADVYLIAMQIELVGKTTVRCQDLISTEVSRWVIMARQGLNIPLSRPEDPVGTEVVVPDTLWNSLILPNTVMPSFITCNLSRDYQVEVKLGLAWGNGPPHSSASTSSLLGRSKPKDISNLPQEIHLPLHFSSVQVYSGLAPPPALLEAMLHGRHRTSRPRPPPTATPPPTLPPRPTATQQQQQQPEQQPTDTLYPPQLHPDQPQPPYDDAPPTYEEAMAEEMTGPVFPSTARPAYSGETNENAPSTLPGKT